MEWIHTNSPLPKKVQDRGINKQVPNRLNAQNGESHKPSTSFEDAIILTEHGKFHLLLSVGCGLCLFAMVGEVFGTAFMIPAAQCEFEMGSSEKGLLNAIGYIGMIASSHFWGYLADTRGRRKVLIVALLSDAVCGLVSSLAHTYWLFAFLRFFNGFFICAPSAVVFAYLGEFHSGHTRSRAVMLMSVFLSLGGLFQQGLAWVVIPQDWAVELPWPPIIYRSWRVFVLINAMPSVVTAAILFVLPESPKFLLSREKEEEALEVLRHIFSVNTGQKAEDYPVTRVVMDINEIGPTSAVQPTSVLEIIKSMWAQTKPLFQRPNVLLTTLAFIMQFSLFASFNGFALWLPDMYNRFALYTEENPDHGLTICDVIAALGNRTANSGKMILTYAEIADVESFDAVAISTGLKVAQDVTGYIASNMSTLTDAVTENTTEAALPCSATVDPTVFRNSLAIGVVCMTVYTGAGYLVKIIKKKPLMMVFMLMSSVSGATLYVANNELLIVGLSSIFIAMSGVCVNMVNSIVIDNIPTQLRAMAVCLSLMSGRLGVTVCSLVLGVLLDLACDAAFFGLSGFVLLCCFLTCLLPGPPKNTS